MALEVRVDTEWGGVVLILIVGCAKIIKKINKQFSKKPKTRLTSSAFYSHSGRSTNLSSSPYVTKDSR